MRSHGGQPGPLERTPFGVVRLRPKRWRDFFRGDKGWRAGFWMMNVVVLVQAILAYRVISQYDQAIRDDIVAQGYVMAVRPLGCSAAEFSGDGATWVNSDHIGSTPMRFVRLRNLCTGMILQFHDRVPDPAWPKAEVLADPHTGQPEPDLGSMPGERKQFPR